MFKKYWEKLTTGKGTVAEPWLTFKEVLSDPKTKKTIKFFNSLEKAEKDGWFTEEDAKKLKKEIMEK